MFASNEADEMNRRRTARDRYGSQQVSGGRTSRVTTEEYEKTEARRGTVPCRAVPNEAGALY